MPTGHAGKGGKSPKQLTGMIIGDDMVLSPREVKQMRSVPELVFINCCHLGLIEPSPAQDDKALNLRNDYNLIAANVATEFIEMGVRAGHQVLPSGAGHRGLRGDPEGHRATG